MAADIKKIIENLRAFYDVSDKSIIWIGAGGGQFVEFGRPARQVTAIDNDEEALGKLRERLRDSDLAEKFELIQSDFFLARYEADVVFFEFCLHEMPDAAAAIRHALTMAPHVLVADHYPGSKWVHYVDETEKVERSWEALRCFPLQCVQQHESVQFFHSFEELYQKVKSEGETAIKRIERYREMMEFTIPMSYGFAVI